MLVAATDGTYAGDIRPLVRLSISVLAQKGDRRERGSAGGGGRFYGWLLLSDDKGTQVAYRLLMKRFAKRLLLTLKQLLRLLGAMPVGSRFWLAGVLLHEAVESTV